jgi:dienelactone hydrolase
MRSRLLIGLVCVWAVSSWPRGFHPGVAQVGASATLTREDDAFLEDLSKRAFQFFWEQADSTTGIVRDRSRTDGSASSDNHVKVGSIASVGFALTGYCIAAERGWEPRDALRARTTTTLQTFATRVFEQHGWFYHWLNLHTGAREWTSEVSSIDTALLLGGVLSVRQCFRDDPAIVRLADAIYRRVDFTWMLNGHPAVLSHGWRPETGMIVHRWDAYSEAMLLYVLGLGSPTFPLPAASWRAWVRPELEWPESGPSRLRYVTHAGPLFLHQYSHAWIDFRGWRDPEPPHDWFANAATATRANRQYCLSLAGRFPGYSDRIWGITASDARGGYRAWGGPPPDPQVDGTVVPCAAAGSLMLTPEIALPALREMHRRFGDRLYGRYGFADAFHPTDGWINPDVIGIDVGITLLSAENLRSGNVWRWFMANPEIDAGLRRAGLSPSPRPRGEGRGEGRPVSSDDRIYRLIPSPDPPALEAARRALQAIPTALGDRFERATFAAPNGVRLPYRLLRPVTLEPLTPTLSPQAGRGGRWPLVVVFHGSGQIGSDNASHLTGLALAWARDETRRAFPAFVLAPQMPARSAVYSAGPTGDRRTSAPGPPLDATLALIDHLVATRPIDPNRLYLVGFSMGASTTWQSLAQKPGRFAAAVAIAGVPNVADVAAVARTPLWIVHGNRDDSNPIRHDRAIYQPLVDAGGRVRFWEIDRLDHTPPPWLVAGDDFAQWLFAQRRGSGLNP